jgi:hypothetical protein
MAAGNECPRYRDAITAFLGRSTLPAKLKMAAVLALVSSVDVDPRLALGRLAGELEDFFTDWPESVAGSAGLTTPCVAVPSGDPWLQAYVAGRWMGLRDTLAHDGTRFADWENVFWNQFLEMSCRWADLSGVQLAFRHGAEICYDNYAAIAAAAGGTHGTMRGAYYTRGRTHADYCQVIDTLLGNGTSIEQLARVAVCSAARSADRWKASSSTLCWVATRSMKPPGPCSPLFPIGAEGVHACHEVFKPAANYATPLRPCS